MGAEGQSWESDRILSSAGVSSLQLYLCCHHTFEWCHVLKDLCANTYKEKLFSILLRIIILISLRVRPSYPCLIVTCNYNEIFCTNDVGLI